MQKKLAGEVHNITGQKNHLPAKKYGFYVQAQPAVSRTESGTVRVSI